MNAITKKEVTALTLPQRAAVALGAAEHETKLRELVKSSADIVAVVDVAGREQAHRIGMTLKNARVAIEKAGKAAREDAQAFSKAVITEEKRLIDIVTDEEGRVFGMRDQFDAKLEAERQAAIAAERARTEAIADAIEGIREREMNLIRLTKTAEQAQAEIANLTALDITEAVYQERFDEACALKQEVLGRMLRVQDERYAAEAAAAEAEQARLAEVARMEAERAAMEKQRAELDAIAAQQAAEAKRIADLAAAQERAAAKVRAEAEAKLRAEQEAQAEVQRRAAAELKAAQDKLAADIAAHEARKQAEIDAAEQAIADEAARMADEAERDRLQALADQHLADERTELIPPESFSIIDAMVDSYEVTELDNETIIDMGREYGLELPELATRLEQFVIWAREQQ